MRPRRTFAKWLVVLGMLHGIVVCAGFFAPYDPVEQDRKSLYLPPMRLHLMDENGHLHMRPFAYSLRLREGSFDQYEEDTTELRPVKFFLRGARYWILGFLPGRMHFFGAENTRIYLLGTDAYGRDQFSRFLFAGQVSLLAGLLGAGLTLLLGLCVGAVAGYYGGLGDSRLLRFPGRFFGLSWVVFFFSLPAFLPLPRGPLWCFFFFFS